MTRVALGAALLASLGAALAGCEARDEPVPGTGARVKHTTTAESPALHGRTFHVGLALAGTEGAARDLRAAIDRAARGTDIVLEAVPPGEAAGPSGSPLDALIVGPVPSDAGQRPSPPAGVPVFTVRWAGAVRAAPAPPRGAAAPAALPVERAGQQIVQDVARYLKGDPDVPRAVVVERTRATP